MTKSRPGEPRAVVETMYAAFGRGDVVGVLALVSDDCDWRCLAPKSVPFGGEYRGRAAVSRFFERVGGAMRFTAFRPGRFVVEGDTVVVLGRDEGFVIATNRAVAYDWTHVFTVKDGRVAAFREFFDAAAIDAAFAPG